MPPKGWQGRWWGGIGQQLGGAMEVYVYCVSIPARNRFWQYTDPTWRVVDCYISSQPAGLKLMDSDPIFFCYVFPGGHEWQSLKNNVLVPRTGGIDLFMPRQYLGLSL